MRKTPFAFLGLALAALFVPGTDDAAARPAAVRPELRAVTAGEEAPVARLRLRVRRGEAELSGTFRGLEARRPYELRLDDGADGEGFTTDRRARARLRRARVPAADAATTLRATLVDDEGDPVMEGEFEHPMHRGDGEGDGEGVHRDGDATHDEHHRDGGMHDGMHDGTDGSMCGGCCEGCTDECIEHCRSGGTCDDQCHADHGCTGTHRDNGCPHEEPADDGSEEERSGDEGTGDPARGSGDDTGSGGTGSGDGTRHDDHHGDSSGGGMMGGGMHR